MTKEQKNKLLSPPQYDPRETSNKDRLAAGAALGHKLQAENLPVRILSKQQNMFRVTIPKWLADEIGFEKGDGIVFAKTDIPGALLIFAITLPEPYAGNQNKHPGVPF